MAHSALQKAKNGNRGAERGRTRTVPGAADGRRRGRGRGRRGRVPRPHCRREPRAVLR